MELDYYINYIDKHFKTKNGVITSKKFNGHEEFLNSILELTKHLKDFDMTARVQIVFSGNLEQKTCKRCGGLIGFSKKYFIKTFCCKKCSSSDTNSSEEQKEKYKQTCLQKYGVNNTFQIKEVIENIKEIKKPKMDVISDKISKTIRGKYENNFNVMSRQHLNTNEEICEEYIIANYIKDKRFLLEDFCKDSGYSISRVNQLKKEYGIFDTNYNRRINRRENEIAEFIGDCDVNRRFVIDSEIDVFSEKHKLCIEYNGLMWHSHGVSSSSAFNNPICNKTRHLLKTEQCEEKGYQLFHIFDNEWLNKQDIWKSVINNKIGNATRIFARNCVVKKTSNVEAKEFEERNHLQGAGKSSIKIGLYYNDELVSLMTFGKSRFTNKYDYELIRFCSKLNTTIVGGASKLLTYFERNYKPKSLISYANRRWSTGDLYKKLGFEFKCNTKPNYFYFKPNEYILYSRMKFQKHKLKNILDVFDTYLSEEINMYNNGYRKIYDSGNKVYIKNYN